MGKLATTDIIFSIFKSRHLVMVYACSKRHQTGDTDSFQLVILLPVQLDSQGTFVPCEARIVWYSAGRTSSRQLRDTTTRPAMPNISRCIAGISCAYDPKRSLWPPPN